MKKTKGTAVRSVLTILTGLICVLLFGIILSRVQEKYVMTDIRTEMEENTVNVRETYLSRQQFYPNARDCIRTIRSEDLKFLRFLSANDPFFEISDSYLAQVEEELDLSDVLIIDREGNVEASASGISAPLRAKRYEPLRTSFMTGEMGMVRRLSDKEAWAAAQQESDAEADESAVEVPDAKAPDPYDQYILYALPFDEDHAFVLMEYGIPVLKIENSLNSWVGVLKNVTVGVHGFSFVWDDRTKELVYYPDESLRFQDVSALGMDMELVKDGGFEWNEVNGETMYVHTMHFPDENVWIASAVPAIELAESGWTSGIAIAVLFLLIVADVVYYAILLLRQRKVQLMTGLTGPEFAQPSVSRRRKLFIFTVFMAIVIFALTFYLQTLFHMSTWVDDNERQFDLIEQRLEENEENARSFAEQVEKKKYCQLNLLILYMEQHPNRTGELFLNAVSRVLGLRDATVFDLDGNVKTTCSDESYRYLDAKTLTRGLYELTENTETVRGSKDIHSWMDNGGITLLAPIYDKDGNLEGHFYARYYSAKAADLLKHTRPDTTLSLVSPGENGFVFAVDKETGNFAYYPDKSLIGRNAGEYGLKENQIRDNFKDFIYINKTSYYAATALIGENLVYYTIAERDLFRQRIPIAAASGALAFIFLLITGLPLYTSRQRIEMLPPVDNVEDTGKRSVSPEYKAYSVLTWYAAAFAALFAFYSLLHRNGDLSSVLDYVMDGNWEHGLNVFALTASVITVCEGGLVVFLGRKFVNALAGVLPVRGGTIIRMLSSLATYFMIFYLAYRCLVCFGMNPTTFMASAGIVSVVLGIGANSLVGDIIAGIFLLMEGDIQVGDVVRVGDFRGYIQEMGIRRTKIFDMDTEDVRIVPNKGIQDVVNLSAHSAVVRLLFEIGYEENLERVEELIKEELKTMYGHMPYLLAEPRYLGVRELGANGITLLCTARAHEAFRFQVQREITRRVYLMFKKNGIEVPYPQITVHEADGEH